MSTQTQSTLLKDQDGEATLHPDVADGQRGCPVCGAMTEVREIGDRMGWTCLVGGYAHYYQARYGYLKRWFTSGEGNLREPVIRAMNCVA